jgi:cytochrome c oxidase subunit I+III
MHWTGLLGMPRRVYTYPTGLGWDGPNLASSIFGFVMAFGAAAVLLDLVLHWRFGRKAAHNPWQADTLEWASGTPPRSYNFASLPTLATRHPLWQYPDMAQGIAEGRYGLPQAVHGRRETMGSDPVSGQPREVLHLPGNSWLPLIAALLLSVLCIALLLRAYGFALAVAASAAVVLLRWSWENGAHPKAVAGEAHDLPEGLKLHSRTFDGPGLWGMGLTMLADAALYFSLMFGWLFLWTVAPNWQMPPRPPLGAWPLAAVGLALGVGAWLLWRCTRQLREGRGEGLRSGLIAVAGSGAIACVVLVALIVRSPLQPEITAHDAVISFTLVYLLLHAALATVLAAMQAWRVRLGHVSVLAPYEPGVLALLWQFTTAAAALAWLVLSVLPAMLGAGQ